VILHREWGVDPLSLAYDFEVSLTLMLPDNFAVSEMFLHR